MMLAWVGSRCTTRMKAMPVFRGMFAKKRSQASRPPAEAPMPTMLEGPLSLLDRDGGSFAGWPL